jgi:hypothetical protein
LKTPIKYQIVLLFTLIAGYCQLVVSLTRYDTIANPASSEQVKPQVGSLLKSDILYFEEKGAGEDNRLSKRQTELTDYISLFNSSAWGFPANPLLASIAGKTICYPASAEHVYRALRL